MSDSTSTSTNYYGYMSRNYASSGPAVNEDLTRVWISHESGLRTPIRDMQDDHLMAAINMIKRGCDFRGIRLNADYNIKLPMLEQEARHRGLIPQNDGWDL